MSRRLARSTPWLLLGWLAGCVFSTRFGDGQVRCGVDGGCPPGLACAGDQRCYGTPPDLADASDGGADLAPDPCGGCGEESCGTMLDRCGRVLRCTTSCPSTAPVCGGDGPNVCGTNRCVPRSTCLPVQVCGLASDGCANLLACGTCAGGSVCAGDGTPNVCCTPATACPSGANCGFAPDGCFGRINCGPSCPTGMFCGGGGTPNVCGPMGRSCSPVSCAQQGKNCGTISNGCNNVIRCGTCSAGQVCVGNVCMARSRERF
jgi:hypothetical protein